MSIHGAILKELIQNKYPWITSDIDKPKGIWIGDELIGKYVINSVC